MNTDRTLTPAPRALRLPITLREASLLAAAVAFVFYVAMDAVCALRYPGYSYADQTISELSAVDAPTRGLWLVLTVPFVALTVVFAIGVLAAARSRRVSVIGWLLLAYAAGGVLWPFVPMHQREVLAAGGDTARDALHLVMAGVTSTLFLAMIVVGAWAFGPRFRAYSFVTLAVLLVFGAAVGLGSGGVADNSSTPWLGVAERINVFGAMLWMAVFGVVLRGHTRRSGVTP